MARTLLLDLDGTLVDTVPDIAGALNRMMLARALPACTTGQVAGMVGDGVDMLVKRAFAIHGMTPDATALQDFGADYGAHVAVESRLYPSVDATLQRLRQDGWTLAVCTNKPKRAAQTLLAAMGLLPLLHTIGGGDSFATRKPDPAHLLATLAAAGGQVDRAVMLGDHRNDVLAAAGAGMPCIFAAWGYGAPFMAEGSAASAVDMTAAAAIANRLVLAEA